MDDMKFPDFSNQIVAVEVGYDEDEPFIVLERPRFEIQAGRVFLLGRVPYNVNEVDWCAGAACGVAWDEVVSYYLFDSVEDYLEKIGEA